MSSQLRLTKKQKKAVAFRERKTGKGKGKERDADHDNDVPVMEDQDMADQRSGEMEIEKVAVEEATKSPINSRPSRKNSDQDEGKPAELGQELGKEKTRKRKPEMAVENTDEGTKRGAKRRKSVENREALDTAREAEEGDEEKERKSQVKQRFILFVGNLKYTTSLEAINAHFAACDPPPLVRLLTPKPSIPGKSTSKSKGCAFLEFSHRNALQQALKLHQTELDGRMINVELTAGGGGKSETRLTKVRERNKGLFGQRKERMEKQNPDMGSTPTMPERPQRYSATSGIDQAPLKQRTWTVGDSEDKHRGGKKHSGTSRTKRPKGKTWGTGVNAIPVG